ncbi:reverse transcriptase domain-containing protein [Tanacetum coccineum]
MVDQRTMAELLRAPTEGYAEAIVVPPILAEHFELKHSLINMMTSGQFFGLEKDNPHNHIPRRWLEKEPPRSILTWEDLVSKFINEFFPPSRTTNLRNEISNFEQRFGESFHEAWDRYKDLLRACPHHGFTELHQLDTFYNALNPGDQDSLNSTAGGNLLERSTPDVLTIIENKSKVRNSRNKSLVSQVKSSDVNSSSSSDIAKLTHAVNQQTSVVICIFLPFPECDSLFYEDFSEVDALSSTNNEDKVFNPGILIHENLFEITNCATPDKNVKKISYASLILEDFNHPLYELPFHKRSFPELKASTHVFFRKIE